MRPSFGSQALDRAPLGLGLLYLVGVVAFWLMGVPPPHRFSSAVAFAAAFEEQARRELWILFPLGTATSMAIVVALMRHGRLNSPRGRFQALALGLLFVLAMASLQLGEPTAGAIVRAATDGTQGMTPLLERWSVLRTTNLVLSATVALCLVAGQRMPTPTRAGAFAALSPRQRTLLFLLGAATLFEGYDRFIVSLALPYIADDLAASEDSLGYALSVIRLGALASVVLGRLADRHGRRRLLLLTILAYTVATAATGLSRGLGAFVVFQLTAMVFLVTELSLAQVVITEEFPTSFRARGQGLLGAFGALGAGMAALLFPMLERSPLGWRGLYFIGILPLLLIAFLRRSLPETERWQQARDRGETERARLRELLAPAFRTRFAILIGLSMVAVAAYVPAFSFASYRATKVFHWEPQAVSGMILLGGGLGLGGWFLFGVLAERLGRRVVGAVAILGGAAAISAYYQTAWLFPAFGLLVFMEAGAQIAINALGTELFPTRLRGAAKAWITNAGIVGAALGLAFVGRVGERVGGVDSAVTILTLLPCLLCPLLFLLPEPRGLELEQLSDEEAGGDLQPRVPLGAWSSRRAPTPPP